MLTPTTRSRGGCGAIVGSLHRHAAPLQRLALGDVRRRGLFTVVVWLELSLLKTFG